MGLSDIIDTLLVIADSLGYIGLFAISFVASIIIFVPIPFFPILAIMSIDPKFDPHLLAFSSAMGASIAKVIIFYSSYYGRRFISRESRARMRPLQRLLKRYGWYASFIAAATPIPDDLVYIPLGLAKYNPFMFFTSLFAGKMLISEAVVWGTRAGFNLLEYVEGNENTPLFYASLIATVVLIGLSVYFMIRVDWGRIIGRLFPWTLNSGEDERDDGDGSSKGSDGSSSGSSDRRDRDG
ncbi:MAG: VTT domain-containing protein [Candidatus Nitrosocaldus sp.]|nr:VTT domain-containing protein [Candidatus Nitrosocaldus sp.]